MNEKEVVILAALLHDIGKFSQRVENEERLKHVDYTNNFLHSAKPFWGDKANELIRLATHHHDAGGDRNALIIQLADWLSAGERQKEERKKMQFYESAIAAITSRIEFEQKKETEKYFSLCRLDLKSDTVFPEPMERIPATKYEELWDSFARCFSKFTKDREYHSNDFITIYYLLKEYGSRIPAATPWEKEKDRTVPDISLFDHSRVACAIAACLCQLDEAEYSIDTLQTIKTNLKDNLEANNKKLCLLLRGDVSGIQNYLYRITRGEHGSTESKGTAKRLRGRSFYLSLLTQVAADWLRRKFQLPIANILFCGGGRFDLLLPNLQDISERLKTHETELQQWLLHEFNGELGIVWATTEVSLYDFSYFSDVYRRVDDKLNEKKHTKFLSVLDNETSFFTPDATSKKEQQPCPCCEIEPANKNGDNGQAGNQCALQKDVGGDLPKLQDGYLVFSYHPNNNELFEQTIKFKELGVTIGFVAQHDKNKIEKICDKQKTEKLSDDSPFVYRLNTPAEFWFPTKQPISFGFQFLGNTAPVLLKDWPFSMTSEDEEKPEKGHVLEFARIAELSDGADYLGVLKMDVDHLGLVFGIGIDNPSISRLAALSSEFDMFFAGWLNNICREVTNKWQDETQKKLPDDPRLNLVESLFYIVYSGGDDLMIIGPWEQTLKLAQHIHDDFSKFAGGNPNIHLSAGLVLVKPSFPIQRFADLASEALEKAKNEGRNRIHVFGITLDWYEYRELITMGDNLIEALDAKQLRRAFIYYLLRLHQQHLTDEGDGMYWIPKYYYAVTRTVGKEVLEKNEKLRTLILEEIPKTMRCRQIPVPVSYVSLKIREK